MFIHNIDPIAFSIGPVNIYYYGLVYALGFLFTYWYLYRSVERKRFNITHDQLDTLFIYIILGVVVGGRVGEYLFWQPQLLFSDPLSIFRIWEGGMAFHGGVLGVAIALSLFCKKYKVHFYDISDRLVIPASITLAFGRIANFINGELPGTITNAAFSFNFRGEVDTQGNLVFRHPIQLYATLKNTVMAAILIFESKRKQAKGYLTWMFVFIYGLFRFIVNFWREDVLWFFGILSTGQVLSLAMCILAGIVLYKNYWCKRGKK
jgi:phosphatidylglycerol:prolipoprotein diacylglycerol transferase